MARVRTHPAPRAHRCAVQPVQVVHPPRTLTAPGSGGGRTVSDSSGDRDGHSEGWFPRRVLAMRGISRISRRDRQARRDRRDRLASLARVPSPRPWRGAAVMLEGVGHLDRVVLCVLCALCAKTDPIRCRNAARGDRVHRRAAHRRPKYGPQAHGVTGKRGRIEGDPSGPRGEGGRVAEGPRSTIGAPRANSRPKTMNSRPKTMNLRPKMMNSRPKTMNSRPKTMNSRPKTMNSRPKTMNSRPKTTSSLLNSSFSR
jgi:hypothetical protein